MDRSRPSVLSTGCCLKQSFAQYYEEKIYTAFVCTWTGGGSVRIGMDGEQLLARCCKTHLVLDLDWKSV